MSRELIALIDARLVQHTIGARPTLAGDGVDVTGWRTNVAFGSALAALFVEGTLAGSLSSPAGGADGPELWGYRLGAWWKIGVINNGTAVDIAGAGRGFAQAINVIGIFERLAVAGTASAGVMTAKLAPIERWQTP